MARRGLALFVLGLLAATPAAAQKASPGQVAYVDGLRAFDAGDYATAIRILREVVDVEPRPEWMGLLAETQAWGREFVQGQGAVQDTVRKRGDSENETIAIAREAERHVQQGCVLNRLGHPGTNRMVVVLGLDHREREVVLEEEQVVGALHLAAHGDPAPDDHAARGEHVLAPDLRLQIPPRARDRERVCGERVEPRIVEKLVEIGDHVGPAGEAKSDRCTGAIVGRSLGISGLGTAA